MPLTRTIGLAVALALAPMAARAGAWTQAKGHWQIIATTLASQASRSFDSQGSASQKISFHKFVAQTDAEYGWNNRVTLFFDTETADARSRQPGLPQVGGVDTSYEGGARLLLTNRIGILSMEVSARTAGAFNFSVSANSNVAGKAAEVRLLYGKSFRAFGDDGFVDLEAGMRVIQAPRPNETPIDLTVGLHLTPSDMVMLQSFNLIASGDGSAPYGYYRTHKLELSYVRRLGKHTSIQIGGYVSPLGQNALQEQGVCLGLWTFI